MLAFGSGVAAFALAISNLQRRRLGKRPHQRAFAKLDLECVMLLNMRARKRGVGGGPFARIVDHLTLKFRFCRRRAPGCRGKTTERDPRLAHLAVLEIECHCRGREREFVRLPVSYLEEQRTAGPWRRRNEE